MQKIQGFDVEYRNSWVRQNFIKKKILCSASEINSVFNDKTYFKILIKTHCFLPHKYI